MSHLLTQQQIDAFGRDGFVSPVQVLSAGEVEYFRAQCAEFESKVGDPGIIWRRMLHFHFDWAFRLATHPAVLDAVEDILGADVVVLATILFSKPPDGTQYVAWHQDGSPMVRDGRPLRCITAWIALSESNQGNGCLRVVPGTHHTGYHPHIGTQGTANMLRGGEHVDFDFDEQTAVPLVLHPGQMSLHHVDLVHGSDPNRSGERRIGFTVRFASAEVELKRAIGDRVVARGTPRTDLYPVYTGTPHPDMEAGLRSQRIAMQEMLAREAATGVRY